MAKHPARGFKFKTPFFLFGWMGLTNQPNCEFLHSKRSLFNFSFSGQLLTPSFCQVKWKKLNFPFKSKNEIFKIFKSFGKNRRWTNKNCLNQIHLTSAILYFKYGQVSQNRSLFQTKEERNWKKLRGKRMETGLNEIEWSWTSPNVALSWFRDGWEFKNKSFDQKWQERHLKAKSHLRAMNGSKLSWEPAKEMREAKFRVVRDNLKSWDQFQVENLRKEDSWLKKPIETRLRRETKEKRWKCGQAYKARLKMKKTPSNSKRVQTFL